MDPGYPGGFRDDVLIATERGEEYLDTPQK